MTTDHPDILIAKSRELDFSKINELINSIEALLIKNDEKEAIRQLKVLVPEFTIDPQNKIL